MNKKRIAKVLFLVVFLAVLPIETFVHADVPTNVQYSANPSLFGEGVSSSTFICMTNETDPAMAVSFNTGDLSTIVLDPSVGTVTSINTPITVHSSTLLASDFSAALAANPNKIKLTYTNAVTKPFGFGDSVCVQVNFTSSVSPAAALVRFSNKFTGSTGLLPASLILVVDPSLLPPSGALTSTNPLPGTAPGTVFVNRSTGSNPGQSFTVQAGSAAAVPRMLPAAT